MEAPAIACHGLTKRYRRGWSTFAAVDDLALTVPRGVTFGLLGPNGAGKTTTIQMLLGLVRPSAGTAEVLGGAIQSLDVRRRIGFVPEKFQLPPFLSAEEFLDIQGRLCGMRGPALQKRVQVCLEQVGLAARRRDRAGGFSKGMQQRLVLAQALLHEPELLVLDEPTSALDPVGRREVRAIIREAHERGATVLLNSHLLSEVEAVCEEVAILRNGRLVRQGPIHGLTGAVLRVDARVGDFSPEVQSAVAALTTKLEAHPREAGHVDLAFEVATDEQLPAIARAIVAAGGSLYALTPHHESLEDLFMRLVETPQ
ncbi:MAG TPA: ABC transporter ATP-binding protein [Oscillatoriaceae cyanobacterium]